MGAVLQPQSFAVKRNQVEFHNFASLGEPERAIEDYEAKNLRRAAILRKHRDFIGEMTPFLEIGASVGHTSYLLANEFGATGFALDLSADALRQGVSLMDRWHYSKGVTRVAGDAAKLPFQTGSLRLVTAFQMLSQFMNIEQVFLEVKRVLAPGGVFLFAEEPIRRKLSLRLFRAPYYDTMKPWERRLADCNLLEYVVRDVIGAGQEESFGIRQNHSMRLADWDRLVKKHFPEQEYQVFVPKRGWADQAVAHLAGSEWNTARLLGGSFTAVCRTAGTAPQSDGGPEGIPPFESLLMCPDCRGVFIRQGADLLCRDCGYLAVDKGGVYNVLPSADRAELYPGDRADIVDFSLPGHEKALGTGWFEAEGTAGACYRWMSAEAEATLVPVLKGHQRLRIRGHAPKAGSRLSVCLNGLTLHTLWLDRSGLFVYEADVPRCLSKSGVYNVVIRCSPTFQAPPDVRKLSVTISMIRLVPRDRSC